MKKVNQERNIPLDFNVKQIDILKNLGVQKNNKLNFTGVLAFGKNIQQYLPDIIVKCAVFEGLDKTGRILDHIEIKDNLFKQIDLIENFILRNLRKSAWINPATGRREEKYELPYLAIREAVANAVAHRDYRISSHIDIAIFDDRVEVWSPGELPDGLTIKDIKNNKVSVLRNPCIAEILFLAGYIERWGSGIQKMDKLMKEYLLNVPDYSEINGNFLVTFKRKNESVCEQDNEQDIEQETEQVRKLLNVFGSKPLSTRELMKKLNITHRPTFIYEYLQPALEKNLIKMTIPDKPTSKNQKYYKV